MLKLLCHKLFSSVPSSLQWEENPATPRALSCPALSTGRESLQLEASSPTCWLTILWQLLVCTAWQGEHPSHKLVRTPPDTPQTGGCDLPGAQAGKSSWVWLKRPNLFLLHVRQGKAGPRHALLPSLPTPQNPWKENKAPGERWQHFLGWGNWSTFGLCNLPTASESAEGQVCT